jgi:hypothetical protein
VLCINSSNSIRGVIRPSARCDVPRSMRPVRVRLLEAQLNARDVECGMFVITSYPARRHVSLELDGTEYVATVALKEVSTLQAVSTTTRLPTAH